MKKKILIIVGIIIIILGLVVAGYFFLNKEEEKQETKEEVQQETTDSDVINLALYSDQYLIEEAGEYTFTGSLTGYIMVRTTGNVIINLDNVEITSNQTAAIIGDSAASLTINLLENSINTLTDGGSSDYDGVIFCNCPLIINGSGTLNINSNQEEGEGIATEENDITINSGIINVVSQDDGINAGGDKGGTITINDGTLYINAQGDGIDSNNNAIINGGKVFVMGSANGGNAGIDTDNGYEINGGIVVALGSDMLETPTNSSIQNTLCLTLDSSIQANTNISLVDSNNSEIISFRSEKQFKTIIISTSTLVNGTYSLISNTELTGKVESGIYTASSVTGGSVVSINGTTSLAVNSNVTNYGKTMFR